MLVQEALMIFEMHSVRQAYAEVLEHEVKKVVRMLRAFPAGRFDERQPDCAYSARALAAEFVADVRGIEELTYGRVLPRAASESRTRGGILLEFETAAMGAYAALMTLPASRWGEVLEVPQGLAPWEQARRGELLWLALREMVRRDRHFALHLKAARQVGGDGSRRTARERETIGTFAIGA
jgi:hypothetical protein